MFVKYTFNAGWTIANFMQDLKNLLTGAININSCTSACNIAQSTQLGSGSFGLHDEVVASNYFVLSAYDGDQWTTKYCKFLISSSSLGFTCAEDWNNSTHVATNAATQLTASIPGVGIAGAIFIATSGTDWVLIGNSGTGCVMWGEILRETPLLATNQGGVVQQSQFTSALSTAASITCRQPKTRTFSTIGTYTTPGASISMGAITGAVASADVYDGNAQTFIQANPAIAYQAGSFLGRIRGGVKTGHSAYVGATWGDVIYVDGTEHLVVGSYLFPVVA